jgi:hypothetical protein
MNRSLSFTLLLLAALSAACAFGGKKYPQTWIRDEVEIGSERILWEVTAMALDKEGFPVGSGMDPTSLVATSGWKNSLAPFRGKGWRERAQVRYERVAPGRYRIEVRVERDLNMDIARPMDLSYADWEDAPDDEVAGAILLQRIKSTLGGGREPADASSDG